MKHHPAAGNVSAQLSPPDQNSRLPMPQTVLPMPSAVMAHHFADMVVDSAILDVTAASIACGSYQLWQRQVTPTCQARSHSPVKALQIGTVVLDGILLLWLHTATHLVIIE